MRYLRALAVLAVVAGGAAAGQPEDKTGLKVGTKAPGFKLKDQAGKERSLEELLKGGDYVAIVFHRSADW